MKMNHIRYLALIVLAYSAKSTAAHHNKDVLKQDQQKQTVQRFSRRYILESTDLQLQALAKRLASNTIIVLKPNHDPVIRLKSAQQRSFILVPVRKRKQKPRRSDAKNWRDRN